MSLDDATRRALNLLNETINCASSSFIAIAEALNIELSEDMKNMSIGFAGGISGSGHICGALWGAIAVASLYTMRKLGEEAKSRIH